MYKTLIQTSTKTLCPLKNIKRNWRCVCPEPVHLICFKFWTAEMVQDIINSAINLKSLICKTGSKKLNILTDCKVTMLLEVNEPALSMAVSKAASLLGAHDNVLIDKLIWDKDYFGRIFSSMSDVIFVSTATHGCLQRFSEQSTVPVLCMRSRTHASIQALATIMAIQEEYSCLNGLNISYFGPAAPILNSYLLLCPMLGANIKYKCCCDKTPVSPLLQKISEDMGKQHKTEIKACNCKEEALYDARVVIAGPTPENKKKTNDFKLDCNDINKTSYCWIFFHSCPRGDEVNDELFSNCRSRTFNAFENMQYIAAALMAGTVKGHMF